MSGAAPRLAAAFDYAAQGWPVFPCNPWPDKRPLTAHGFKDATTDPVIIERWWRRWPNAIIGGPTGIKFVALDVDPRHGGFETLAGLGFATLPTTPTVITPGGGKHLYFAVPDPPIRNTTGERRRGIGPGLDWRGAGGYVILPAPGTGYSWVAETRDLPLAAVPSVLLPRQSAEPIVIGTAAQCTELSEYGEAALKSAVAKILAAPNKQQEATLNNEAFSIGRLAGAGGVPREVALRILNIAARNIKDHDETRPWGKGEDGAEGEAEAKVRRAFEQGFRKPRPDWTELVEERERLNPPVEFDP
jgi:hypothetical protein